MTERGEVEKLLNDLYAARTKGELAGVLACFSATAQFEILGGSSASLLPLVAVGIGELRPWLTLLVKTFRIVDYERLSIVIDGDSAAVHWRARIVSKVTGAAALTEFVDLIQIVQGQITRYTEFFVPRRTADAG
jgi:ketosteroid isomerase-like protein